MAKRNANLVVEQVLNALSNGESLSAKEINTRFSTNRANDVIRTLRQNGYCIYGNRRGKETVYRLGQPSRSMIAAAYGVWFGKTTGNQ